MRNFTCNDEVDPFVLFSFAHGRSVKFFGRSVSMVGAPTGSTETWPNLSTDLANFFVVVS